MQIPQTWCNGKSRRDAPWTSHDNTISICRFVIDKFVTLWLLNLASEEWGGEAQPVQDTLTPLMRLHVPLQEWVEVEQEELQRNWEHHFIFACSLLSFHIHCVVPKLLFSCRFQTEFMHACPAPMWGSLERHFLSCTCCYWSVATKTRVPGPRVSDNILITSYGCQRFPCCEIFLVLRRGKRCVDDECQST